MLRDAACHAYQFPADGRWEIVVREWSTSCVKYLTHLAKPLPLASGGWAFVTGGAEDDL